MYRLAVAFLISPIFFNANIFAQDAKDLILKLKEKTARVNDYIATGRLKTNVTFLKIPVSDVTIYFKSPNKFRIKKDKGISILPKEGTSITVNSILNINDFIAVDAGYSVIGKKKVRIIKLLPEKENSNVVLTTLYIDEEDLLVLKAITTTRESGTYEMEMNYNKYSGWGLPDKIVFSFDTGDYKLPKGVTFEFDGGEDADKNLPKNKKGKVEIDYYSYQINKGIPDKIFE